jgi:outer membrane murein-binding lipoprotein Lpp
VDIDNWLQRGTELVGLVGAVVAAAAWVFRWATRRVVTLAQQVSQLGESVEALGTDVVQIRAQLSHNGGSSVKDALDRVDARTAGMARDVGDLAVTVATLSGRFDEHTRAQH